MSPAATLVEALEPLRSDPAHAAVLLDIDGTLAPIVRHAADAHVPEATRTLLIEISRRYGLVGCVSGRQAATARQIVAIGSIAYVGNHGGELLRPGATRAELDPDLTAWSERVREFAARAFTPELQRARVRSEDKQAIAAFHWRGAPDEQAAAALVREIAEHAQNEGFAVHWGRMVLEVRPPSRSTRASASPRCCKVQPSAKAAPPSRPRSTSATTPPTSTPSAACARSWAPARSSRPCVLPSARRRPRPSSPPKPTCRSRARAACAPSCRLCSSVRGVHFVDFLRATVLLSAAAATALAIVTVFAAAGSADPRVVPISVAWWILSAAIGLRLGRHTNVNPSIGRLLADAKASTALPEYRPGATLLNRLWPLLLFTLIAGGLAFLYPQIPGIGAGFGIALALWWRRQDAAVAAIEERDGARFHVLRTSPFRAIALARTPGFKALRPQRIDGATT